MARYWFRQKRFGYGATPNTWQGWLFTIIGVAALVGVVVSGAFFRGSPLHLPWIIFGIAAVAVPFCWIAYTKTQGGWHWRWGGE